MRLTERAQHLMDVLNGNAGNRPLSPVNGRVAATDDELDSMFAAERKTWGNSIVSPEHRQWFRRIEDTLVSNTGRDIDQEVMRRVLPRLNASTTWRETMRIGRAIEDLNYHDVAAVAFHRAALQFAAAS